MAGKGCSTTELENASALILDRELRKASQLNCAAFLKGKTLLWIRELEGDDRKL